MVIEGDQDFAFLAGIAIFVLHILRSDRFGGEHDEHDLSTVESDLQCSSPFVSPASP